MQTLGGGEPALFRVLPLFVAAESRRFLAHFERKRQRRAVHRDPAGQRHFRSQLIRALGQRRKQHQRRMWIGFLEIPEVGPERRWTIGLVFPTKLPMPHDAQKRAESAAEGPKRRSG